MSIWYRVFAGLPEEVSSDALLLHVLKSDLPVQAKFLTDDRGWFQGTFSLSEQEIILQRFLSSEKGVRHELNAFAAWIESQEKSTNLSELMHKVITAPQAFSIEISEEQGAMEKIRQLCQVLVSHLAKQTEGLLQIDGEGLFDHQGKLLLGE